MAERMSTPQWTRRGMILVAARPQAARVGKPAVANPRATVHRLNAARKEVEYLRAEVTGLRRILYAELAGLGVICEACGCLCKPRETCPMCLWITLASERKVA